MDSSVLKSKLVRGDRAAFESVYYTYIDELLSYALSLGFEREEIKDAIQDIFFKVYINRKQIAIVDNLKYYLFRSLKNRLLDILKTRRMQTSDITTIPELTFSIQACVLEDLIEDEDRLVIQNKVKNLLNILTDKQREAVYLRYMHEMSFNEIAEMLDITPKSAQKLVSRALERMKDYGIPLAVLLWMFESVI